MNESGQGKGPSGYGLWETAGEVARAGDRWFLRLARGLGAGTHWLENESSIVAESARKAAATTGRWTAMLMKLPRRPPGSWESGERRPASPEELGRLVATRYHLPPSELQSDGEASALIERIHHRCMTIRETERGQVPADERDAPSGSEPSEM